MVYFYVRLNIVELLALEITRLDYFVGTLLLLLFIWLLVRKRERLDMSEDPRNHTIRQLDADLRLAERELVEARELLEKRDAEIQEAVNSQQELHANLAIRESEAEALRAELNAEAKKTRELREELTDQAQERLREHVSRKEAETELEVARAGSEAVMDEIISLQEQQQVAVPRAQVLESAQETNIDIDIDELLSK